MEVNLSRRGSYVIRSALCLARAYGEGHSLTRQQIAAEAGVPRNFVPQVVGDLIRADLATSTLGKSGGYRLAVPPEEITLLDAVEASSGPLQPMTCPLDDAPCATGGAHCAVHEALEAAAAALRRELAATTLAQVAARDAEADGPWGHVTGGLPLPAVAVADSIQVELAAAVVAARLRADTSWLDRHAEAATVEGSGVRVRVGPGRAGWLGKAVLVHLAAPEGADDDLRIALDWEATGPKALFPRLRGELRVRALDPERCQLSLAGTYQPPFGRAGSMLDDALLTRVADSTVRSFLRRVARTVEDHAASQLPATGVEPGVEQDGKPGVERGVEPGVERGVEASVEPAMEQDGKPGLAAQPDAAR